jgi:hypothetical protein
MDLRMDLRMDLPQLAGTAADKSAQRMPEFGKARSDG